MLKLLHHILEPHCVECKEERLDEKAERAVCNSCQTLKSQLATANHEKQQLLNRILELTAPKQVEQQVEEVSPQALQNRAIPWAVRRQALEAEDREKAKIMAKRAEEEKKILTLEKEV